MAEQGDKHDYTIILLKATRHEVIEDKILDPYEAYLDDLMIARP